MDKLELLEKLILEGDRLASTISYVPPSNGIMRLYDVYKTSSHSEYLEWQSCVERFVKTYFPSELTEIKKASSKLAPGNHKKIVGVLKAIKLFPNEPEKVKNPQKGTNITINNSQNNTQEIVFNIFAEAVKDELTGKELKELKEIILEFGKEPNKNKSKLLDTLKRFGGDTLSNILGNILTNPSIYTGLM